MDNKLMIFEGKNVEVFEFEGRILFNPKDVAKCLDIKDVKSSMRNFSEKQVVKLTNSEVQPMHIRKLNNAGENFLTESGVYKLIFKSQKKEAEKFQDWVTDDVLPTLRNNGTYSITTPTVNNDVTTMVQNIMANILPTMTTEMCKIIVESKVQLDRSQEQINKTSELIYDQACIYDNEREELKELIGFRTKNVCRIVNEIKSKLSEKMGRSINAKSKEYLNIKKLVFKEFKVSTWEEISVSKYNDVYAYVDTYIGELN